MLAVVFGILIIGAIAFAVIFPKRRKWPSLSISKRIDFFSKGKEMGFSTSECRSLLQLAKKTNLAHPGALFWSRVQLDGCIHTWVRSLLISNKLDEEENQNFLAKLFELRKRIELDNKSKHKGLNDTYPMEVLQKLHVVTSGAGVFSSKLIENNKGFLRIERPDSSALPVNFEWKDKDLIVYFSRKDDAHYCFESKVIAEKIPSREVESVGTLQIAHSNKVERTQYRASVRAKTNRSAFLYPAGQAVAAGQSEVITRVKCILEDISETGLAVIAGGHTIPGISVVVQFTLNRKPVSISGTVRAVEFDEKKNTSRLHIQSDMMPRHIYNLVMCFVLGAIKDEDDGIAPPDTNPAVHAEFSAPEKTPDTQNHIENEADSEVEYEYEDEEADTAAKWEWDK